MPLSGSRDFYIKFLEIFTLPNYLMLPVNAPKCTHKNNHYDGAMNFMHRDEEVSRLLLAAALLFFLVVAAAAPPRSAAAVITCGQVVSKLGPCITYLTGAEPLTAACCGGVRSVNAAAATTPNRQAACVCLKSAADRIKGLLQPQLAAGLPGKCGVSVPYPISTSTDCSKIR